nr:hypothetical protein [Anaerolineae bacterium]
MSFLRRRSDQITSGTQEKSKLQLNLTPERQILVALVATILVGCVCSLIAMPRFRPSPPAEETQQVDVPDFSIPTAREAYIPAVELIRQTDAGAQLASAVSIWTPSIDLVQLRAGRNGWAFHFYLPSSGEMATVLVDGEGNARIDKYETWETPPSLIDDLNWRADSSVVADLLVTSCQETIGDFTQASVELWLSMAEENRAALWLVSASTTGESPATCELTINAVTGLTQ